MATSNSNILYPFGVSCKNSKNFPFILNVKFCACAKIDGFCHWNLQDSPKLQSKHALDVCTWSVQFQKHKATQLWANPSSLVSNLHSFLIRRCIPRVNKWDQKLIDYKWDWCALWVRCTIKFAPGSGNFLPNFLLLVVGEIALERVRLCIIIIPWKSEIMHNYTLKEWDYA